MAGSQPASKRFVTEATGLDLFEPRPVLAGGRDLVEGVETYFHGHSYGVPGAGGTNSPRTTWFQRLAARLRAATTTNLNVAGAQAPDCAGKAAASAPAGFRGLVLWDCTINDVNRNGTSGTLAGFQAGLLTWLLTVRAAANFEAETYAAETGTWTAITDAYASAGNARQTTAQNAKASFAASGATSWFVTLGGGVGSNPMGTAIIAVDGTTVATVPLTGIYAATVNNSTRTWFPYAVPVTLPDTGAHTISVTKSDASTGPMIVDKLSARAVAAPLVVLNKAIYPTTGAASATVDQYNAAIDTVAAQVATDGSILIIDPQTAGFTAATMTADGLHPNNLGAAFMASLIQRTLHAISKTAATALRLGIDYNGAIASTAAVAAPGGGTYAADSFGRADSSTVGSTETGNYPWTGYAGWTISNGTLKRTSGSTADNDIVFNDGQSDGTFSFTWTTPTNLSGALVRAAADLSTGYVIWNNANVLTLTKRTAAGGYSNIVASSGGAPAVGDVITIILSGSSIKVKQNGATVITATDATYTGTRYGFFVTGNATVQPAYDNVQHTSAVV